LQLADETIIDTEVNFVDWRNRTTLTRYWQLVYGYDSIIMLMPHPACQFVRKSLSVSCPSVSTSSFTSFLGIRSNRRRRFGDRFLADKNLIAKSSCRQIYFADIYLADKSKIYESRQIGFVIILIPRNMEKK
jgi:hypothetical protein